MNPLSTKLPDELIERFCDIIAYATEEREPEKRERVALQKLLAQIAQTAQRTGLTPERTLIELKAVWTRVCHREPSPGIDDPLWNAVVKMALAAYERARASAA